VGVALLAATVCYKYVIQVESCHEFELTCALLALLCAPDGNLNFMSLPHNNGFQAGSGRKVQQLACRKAHLLEDAGNCPW
jgi:hypothetical protein